jgi:hypothetical protein
MGDRYAVVRGEWGRKLTLEKDGALIAIAIRDTWHCVVKVMGKFPVEENSEYALKKWFGGWTFDVFERDVQLGTISCRGVLITQYTVDLPASINLVTQMFLLFAAVHIVETSGSIS